MLVTISRLILMRGYLMPILTILCNVTEMTPQKATHFCTDFYRKPCFNSPTTYFRLLQTTCHLVCNLFTPLTVMVQKHFKIEAVVWHKMGGGGEVEHKHSNTYDQWCQLRHFNKAQLLSIGDFMLILCDIKLIGADL